MPTAPIHDISVVVPVYQGERTLGDLIQQIEPLTAQVTTPAGNMIVVSEVLLVYDWGPDDSGKTIRDLADRYDFVHPVWLMRNSGQHAATAAGMASSGSRWIATLDEDGQHRPSELGRLIDVATANDCQLVYGHAANGAPHPRWRNATSSAAKFLARTICGSSLDAFTSFRLVDGARARAACAYMGSRTFLDVALSWTVQQSATCDVASGTEGRERSGYRFRTLLSHFWTLVLSSGTRPLRTVSALGLIAFVLGIAAGVFIAIQRAAGRYEDAVGWASVFVAVVTMGGAILFAIGVVAEYVGATLKTAQGRPLFVIGEEPDSLEYSEE